MIQHKISDFINYLEAIFPPQLQESYDNCGMQIGNPDDVCEGILIALDLTAAVVDEAIDTGCNLIITHHPFIFGGIKKITPGLSQYPLILSLVKNEISVFSLHTSLDKHSRGVSDALADRLGLLNKNILESAGQNLVKLVTFCPEQQASFVRQAIFEAGAGNIGNYDCCSFNVSGTGTFRAGEDANPFVGEPGEFHHEAEQRIETIFPSWLTSKVVKALIASHPYEEVAYDLYPLLNNNSSAGLGIIGELEKPLHPFEFMTMLMDVIDIPVLRKSEFDENRVIRKVAVCGGAGASLIATAIAQKADAFITADLKYHDFQMASNRLLLVDAGHYETEVFALLRIKSVISEKFTNFATLISKHKTNFVSYLNK